VKLTRRLSAALLGAAALPLAGCGAAGSGPGGPLPLASHLRIVKNVARCDHGVHRFCGRELVVVASGAAARGGPTALMAAEHAALARAGWSASGGEVAGEASASAPGGRRWVSYGPVATDLVAIGKGNLHRSAAIVAELRHEASAGAPALSMLVVPGLG
jgi:hypothetical protein